MDKDILYGKTCSLCSEKIGFTERNHSHILSDGTLCPRCQMTILQLLQQKEWWIDDETYIRFMQQQFSCRKDHSMPLEKAQVLITLRNMICDTFLASAGLDSGSVFIAQEAFSMPKSPAVFILRALKLKNKAVLQGFTLKGEVQRGDRIRLHIDGTVREFTAIDVIPAGMDPLEKAVFFDRLGINVHSHRISGDGSGWIIIDTEDSQSIPVGVFAAAFQ